MSKIIVNEIESKNISTTPVSIKTNLDLDNGKVFKINGSTVLTSTHVHGKSMPSGDVVGHNDSQTLYSKTLAGFTLSNDLVISASVDVDLVANNSSAISFDSPAKTGILEIVTTLGDEKVKMSGDLEIAGGINTLLTNNSNTGSLDNIVTDNVSGYRFSGVSATTITGFADGTNGKLLFMHNASALGITIRNSSSSSQVGNRIITGNGNDLVLKAGGSLIFQYDGTSNVWRILGETNNNSGENPVTLDLGNTNTTIDFSFYGTTSFRIKNPAEITLSNGKDGVWYTLAIVSDGTYSFTSEVRFPLDNDQPIASANGRVDVYTVHCINTTSGLRYLASFAYDYSSITLP